MTVEEMKTQIDKVWHGLPAVELCFAILDFLTSVNPQQLKMITFRDLVAATGRKQIDSDLLTAVAMLTNSTMSILDARALLVDEDSTEHEISPEDFAQARKEGFLIHPETGLEVENFESHIIPFFVPTERFIAEAHGH